MICPREAIHFVIKIERRNASKVIRKPPYAWWNMPRHESYLPQNDTEDFKFGRHSPHSQNVSRPAQRIEPRKYEEWQRQSPEYGLAHISATKYDDLFIPLLWSSACNLLQLKYHGHYTKRTLSHRTSVGERNNRIHKTKNISSFNLDDKATSRDKRPTFTPSEEVGQKRRVQIARLSLHPECDASLIFLPPIT